jgi:arylsulfatase A-like enzyme
MTTSQHNRPISRPNVVLIMTDDLNAYVEGFGGHPQARTPNIARLAGSGVSFTRAFANNPICSPSRSSLFSGTHCHTSGHFHFAPWYENEILKNTKMMPEYFRDSGYRTLGTGKLLHHFREGMWEEHGYRPNYGPFAFNGKESVAHPNVPDPFRSIGFVDGGFGPLSDVPDVHPSGDAPGAVGWYDKPASNIDRPLRYVSEDDRDPTPDERCTGWAVGKIAEMSSEPQERPFFLGVGYIRPHTPLHAPKKFFDMFPRDAIELPAIKEGDINDTHYLDNFPSTSKGPLHFRRLKESYPTIEEGLRTYLQAYLACVAAVDEEIGKIIDAVDASPFCDNTIIVVTSDNGYNMGEKDYLFKEAHWDESSRIPLVIRAPGCTQPGASVTQPVSLIDIYPTLLELCGLTADTRKNNKGAPLDGVSLTPLLQDANTDSWKGPEGVLSVIRAHEGPDGVTDAHHYSIRTSKWRYTLYSNGDEELYNILNDPYEWTNLEHSYEHAEEKGRLKSMLIEMTGRTKEGCV